MIFNLVESIVDTRESGIIEGVPKQIGDSDLNSTDSGLVDGRGIATDYAVNELNQVVQITRAAANGVFAPDIAEPLPLTDFAYLERLFYDFNDNVVRVTLAPGERPGDPAALDAELRAERRRRARPKGGL